jgi:hypothetical protein
MYYAWQRSEVLTKFLLENLKGRDYSVNLGSYGKIILQ